MWRTGGRRDPLIEQLLTPLARPGATVIIYRWRHELSITIAIGAGLATSLTWLGIGLTLAVLGALAGLTLLASLSPEVRQFAAARAWCVITPHRVRTCFAQAWIQNRAGQVPAVIRATAQPFGERVLVWCRAGTSYADIESAGELLAAACWAVDVVVSRSSRFAQIVYVDVIRRPRWHGASGTEPGPAPADQDAPPSPWADEGPDRRRLYGLSGDDDWHDAA